mmetsp:Transcript_39296/g.97070  ORF Transcript_39296/g.97070 Transcript_39296/m.97070 type:complete len:268 (+) Transcript_39296:131-934(+)
MQHVQMPLQLHPIRRQLIRRLRRAVPVEEKPIHSRAIVLVHSPAWLRAGPPRQLPSAQSAQDRQRRGHVPPRVSHEQVVSRPAPRLLSRCQRPSPPRRMQPAASHATAVRRRARCVLALLPSPQPTVSPSIHRSQPHSPVPARFPAVLVAKVNRRARARPTRGTQVRCWPPPPLSAGLSLLAPCSGVVPLLHWPRRLRRSVAHALPHLPLLSHFSLSVRPHLARPRQCRHAPGVRPRRRAMRRRRLRRSVRIPNRFQACVYRLKFSG